jgi:RNA polymerase sigma-70 factor (ECF subfamily)
MGGDREPIGRLGRRVDMSAMPQDVAARTLDPGLRLVAVDVTPDDALPESALRFEDFYASARPDISRALALALGDVDLALEATDEALVRAYERWPTGRRLDRPEGWVYRVAMNWALSVLRRRRRSDHKLYEPGDTSLAIADPDVHAALSELDVKHRTVIVCRHLLGWSVADTAAALRVREGTVKSRLSRATRILQSRLRHHLDPEELS